MIKASVIGATGYAGEELTRLLLRHPDVEVIALGSQTYKNRKFSSIYPNFRGITDLALSTPDLSRYAEASDVVFLALPHGIASRQVTPEILAQTRIIDLGADYRLKDAQVYEKWYNVAHESPRLLTQAVYGLPELHRDAILKTRLVANPGCYTTTSILALAPLCRAGCIEPDSVIVDAGSGVTGAGKALKPENMYCEVDESLKAYGVATHRHTPEIEQELGLLAGRPVRLNFTPHLIPMQRGILATCYARLSQDLSEQELSALYTDFYKNEPFVRFIGSEQPQTKYVKGSNYVDIGVVKDARTGRVIATAALDNLFKGAAGQAVQNMNILFGLRESAGIDMIPACPI